MPTIRTARIVGAVAAASLLLATAATADAPVQPVVKLTGTVSPSKIGKPHGSVGTPVSLAVSTFFSSNPPGQDTAAVTKAVVSFPKGAVTNGRLFKSCSAAQLTRAHNVLSKCPKGSQIGAGTVLAKAVQLDVVSTGKVAMFNGPGGRSITFNIHATIPADINESFDAPIKRVHGKYGYTLTLVIPHALQEILPDVFVSVRNFKVKTTKATVVSHGVKRGFIEVLTCPKGGKAPVHSVVDFLDGTSAASDGSISCRS
jgi:hypothetical protein